VAALEAVAQVRQALNQLAPTEPLAVPASHPQSPVHRSPVAVVVAAAAGNPVVVLAVLAVVVLVTQTPEREPQGL
jgi:hypothetical protein